MSESMWNSVISVAMLLVALLALYMQWVQIQIARDPKTPADAIGSAKSVFRSLWNSSWFAPLLILATGVWRLIAVLRQTGPVTRETVVVIAYYVSTLAFAFIFYLSSILLGFMKRHLELISRLGDLIGKLMVIHEEHYGDDLVMAADIKRLESELEALRPLKRTKTKPLTSS